MRESRYAPHPQEIEHPKCPKCGAQMWLARVEPDEPGHDKRTFECPACETIISEIVKYR